MAFCCLFCAYLDLHDRVYEIIYDNAKILSMLLWLALEIYICLIVCSAVKKIQM